VLRDGFDAFQAALDSLAQARERSKVASPPPRRSEVRVVNGACATAATICDADRTMTQSDKQPLTRADALPLAALRCFAVLGSSGSLRQAAARLGVSHTAVAKQLRLLEAQFGVRLVLPSRRGISLTPEGQRLHGRVATAFTLLREGIDELRALSLSPPLRLWVAPGLAALWMTPRLEALQRVLPGVEVILVPTNGPIHRSGEAIDVEIRYGGEADAQTACIDLVRPRIVALAAPSWLAAHAGGLDALAGLPLIHEHSRQEWSEWLLAQGYRLERPPAGPMLGSLSTALVAARQGQGPALFPEVLLQQEIASGALVPLPLPRVQLRCYTLQVRQEWVGHPTVQSFLAWIQAEMRAWATPPDSTAWEPKVSTAVAS
jgi:DNA-binding transcriptional LysR family regulator